MSGIPRLVLACGLLVLAAVAQAQEFSGLARIDMARSQASDAHGGIDVRLGLSQGVPYRVYTLGDPHRLVIDFREVDWSAMRKVAFLNSDRVADARFGGFMPGWSRMVLDLAGPYALQSARMHVDETLGSAQLQLFLEGVPEEEFSARSGAPDNRIWGMPPPMTRQSEAAPKDPEAPLIVALDPGHGGIDPGAERGDAAEKHLMLRFALELRETLLRAGGFEVVLTREDDRFVSLDRRVSLAHRAGADVFISLHADALSEGRAHGASLHLLSDQASDAASAKLAERHNRADILAGVDLTGKDDSVVDVLLDLARLETQPRAEQLAQALVLGIGEADLGLNKRPIRRAGFSVLKAADIPSVLLELGFMSSHRDLENLQNADWRARMADAIRDGLQAWRISDAAARELVRQ